jgi:uncharacterized protein
MLKKFLVSFFLLFYALPALAAELPPRLVTVTGEGEVSVVPDEALVNLTVESFDADLSKAKQSNDKAIRNVLATVKKYHVDDKDFQTDQFNVRPDDQYYSDPQGNQKRTRRGYFVSKNVAIRVRDLAQFEALYSEALAGGVNNVNGVTYQSSRLKELKEEARKLAALSAKDKASQLAAPLGVTVGQPYSIQENSVYENPRPMMAAMAMERSMDSNAPTIALGEIKVTSSVTVSFELT